MGLRTKFNLLLLAVTLFGDVLFKLAERPLVDSVAREEVTQNARIMMESAAGARKYTSEQITPILRPVMNGKFYPQTVSAFAAKRSFDVLHAKFPDFSYREAAINPTNLQDRASEWEADIINDFRGDPKKAETMFMRSTPDGPVIELARPIVAQPACLQCHSTAASAPAPMVAIYGRDNGFGWRAGEVVAAQVVSVPASASSVRAHHIRDLLVMPFLAFIAVLFISVNLLLNFVVVRPIEQMAKTAEAISLGKMDTPEFNYRKSDQIGRLAASFNRMHRSLAQALRMIGND